MQNTWCDIQYFASERYVHIYILLGLLYLAAGILRCWHSKMAFCRLEVQQCCRHDFFHFGCLNISNMIIAETAAEQLASMPMRLPFDYQSSASSACTAEMVQFASGLPGDRHHLKAVPIFGGKSVDITVCQRPDGSDWLLGKGSFGKVQ